MHGEVGSSASLQKQSNVQQNIQPTRCMPLPPASKIVSAELQQLSLNLASAPVPSLPFPSFSSLLRFSLPLACRASAKRGHFSSAVAPLPRLLAPIERREGPPSRPRPTRDADCSSLANSVAKASSVLSAPSHCSSRSAGRLAKLQCLSPFPLSPS